MYHCAPSALLLFSVLWLCNVLYRYVRAAPVTRGQLCLPLGSCAVSCLCDILMVVLSEIQVHDRTTRNVSPWNLLLGLTETREWTVPSRHQCPDSRLPCVCHQLPRKLAICEGLLGWS